MKKRAKMMMKNEKGGESGGEGSENGEKIKRNDEK